jgi:hypothetical protein
VREKKARRECGRLEGSRSELRTESNFLLAAIVLLAVFPGKKRRQERSKLCSSPELLNFSCSNQANRKISTLQLHHF